MTKKLASILAMTVVLAMLAIFGGIISFAEIKDIVFCYDIENVKDGNYIESNYIDGQFMTNMRFEIYGITDLKNIDGKNIKCKIYDEKKSDKNIIEINDLEKSSYSTKENQNVVVLSKNVSLPYSDKYKVELSIEKDKSIKTVFSNFEVLPFDNYEALFLLTASQNKGRISLKWDLLDGATRYYVFVSDNPTILFSQDVKYTTKGNNITLDYKDLGDSKTAYAYVAAVDENKKIINRSNRVQIEKNENSVYNEYIITSVYEFSAGLSSEDFVKRYSSMKAMIEKVDEIEVIKTPTPTSKKIIKPTIVSTPKPNITIKPNSKLPKASPLISENKAHPEIEKPQVVELKSIRIPNMDIKFEPIFSPKVMNYKVTLPLGTKVVPELIYEQKDPLVIIRCTQAVELDGTSEIEVSSTDNKLKNVYRIKFERTKEIKIPINSTVLQGFLGVDNNLWYTASSGLLILILTVWLYLYRKSRKKHKGDY